MNEKNSKAPSSRAVLIVGAATVLIAAAVVLALFLLGREAADQPAAGLLEELRGLRGYSRTVAQREYDFFRDAAARDLYGDGADADLDQLAKDRIAEVSARFYLGACLGLCEPYDFATLEFRREQENTIRQGKLDRGETVYGAKQYTLSTYFSYVDSTLETDLLNCLIDRADQSMLDQAEAYYDAHLSSFRQLVSISYELERDGQTTTETVSSAGLRTIQNTGGTLGEFLTTAQPGDVLEYQDLDGAAVRATLVDTVYETPSFADAQAAALRTWLNAEVMDELYDTVARNNPVIFELEP